MCRGSRHPGESGFVWKFFYFEEKPMQVRKTISLFVLAANLAAGTAFANEDLAKKNGCMACHGVDKKIVGPAYKDIAAKYKSDSGAAATLSKHVREGSKGVWGAVAMPPQAGINDDDLKTVAAWILKL
jgi:cytochrome c